MTTRFARIIAGVSLLLCVGTFSGAARAGTVDSAKIVALTESSSGNIAWISLDLPVASPPACATVPKVMAFDTTSAGGKNLLALVYSAFLANKPVTLTGSSTCTVNGSMENLVTVTVVP